MSESQKKGEEHLGSFAARVRTATPLPKNLKRRSSIQKIIHMCNQSCQMFPFLFFWFQDFQVTVQTDIRKVIPFVKSVLALRLGVYLSIVLLLIELAYCLMATLALLAPPGSVFFFSCVGVLIALAFQVFDVALELRRKLRGNFFFFKKKNH